MLMQDVIMHLLLKQPFYGYIAASITPVESKSTATISLKTTPSLMLLYNREWFESLDEPKAIGAIIHELLHIMLLHPFRKGNRESHLWLVACDMAVNEHIELGLLPNEAITVDKISQEIKESIPRLKSAETYYDIISKSDEQLSLVENDKEITVVIQDGRELKASKSIEADSSEMNKNAVKSMISDLLDQAKSEGEIPSGISNYLGEIYATHEVNWRNVLKRFLMGKGKELKRKTCKKESKRFENLPGNRRTIGVEALFAIDESGSISDKQALKFFNELMAVKRITGATVKVTRFDTECTPPVNIDRFVKEPKRIKNGGTDFRPIFKMADGMRIPLLIIFTDGDGTAPENSNQKVLWVLTKGGKKPADFGNFIVFDA